MEYKLIGENNYFGDLQEEFFKNRGIKDIKNFKNLHKFKPTNSYDFKNMNKAVECFEKHIDTSTIGIIIDEDADGITSASLLYQFLFLNFENKIIPIVHEKNKVHGIIYNELEPYIKEMNLLIVPDAGSNDYKEHKLLKEKNIDVIILDHHKVDILDEKENAIIVNNQISKISVDLTGVAMTYKFIKAIADKYSIQDTDCYLDLVMMGLIGDSANTKNLEVQYYIQQGMKKINSPMINALIDKESFSLKGKINQESFGWYLCPDINAVIRLGTHEQRTLLFEAFAQINSERTFTYEPTRGKNKGKIIEETLFEYCARFCASLKAKQQREVKKIIEGNTRVKGLVESIKDDNNKKVLVIDLSNYIKEGAMTGLIANKLMNKYRKPILALREVEEDKKNINEDKNNKIETKEIEGVETKEEIKTYGGSGRGEMIFNFRTKLNQSKLLKGEGHEPAFGIEKTEIKNFEKLEQDINIFFKDENIQIFHIIDFKIPFKNFEDHMIEDLYALSDFWGQDMNAPLIYIENVKVKTKDINFNKNKTTLFFETNFIKYIKFSINEDYIEKVVFWDDEMYYNIIGKPSISEYDGERYMQINIVDMEVLNNTDNKNNNQWKDADWEEDNEEVEW